MWKESGGDNNSRVAEAERIMKLLRPVSADSMSADDKQFYESFLQRYTQYKEKTFVSPRTLFWLRDLVEKYA